MCYIEDPPLLFLLITLATAGLFRFLEGDAFLAFVALFFVVIFVCRHTYAFSCFGFLTVWNR